MKLQVAASLTLVMTMLHSTMGLLTSHRTLRKMTKLFSTLDQQCSTFNQFLLEKALVEPPKRLPLLLDFLKMRDHKLLDPTDRTGMNPFLIPIADLKDENSKLCYIRWPTQKEGMDLQLVKTNPVGVSLVSTSTDQFCHKLAVELDFYGNKEAPDAIDRLNKDGKLYTVGEYLPFLKSGKFPAITEWDLKLVLDRYLLTKVGQFPDSYERLAKNFLNNDNQVSALITCERAVTVFYGWGHPVAYHAVTMNGLKGRGAEARDAARAAMILPKWTISYTPEVCYTVG